MFVKITDNSQYQSDRSRTGGRYSYSETAYLDDNYQIVGGKYETSPEAPYCEKCGTFSPGCGCERNGGLYEPSLEMANAIDDIAAYKPEPGVLFSIVFGENESAK